MSDADQERSCEAGARQPVLVIHRRLMHGVDEGARHLCSGGVTAGMGDATAQVPALAGESDGIK